MPAATRAFGERWRRVRRLLALFALMGWQGGFTFYAAAVVPIGQRVLGSHLAQGLITREVTWALNLWGALALFALALETWGPPLPRPRALRVLWTAMAGALAALFLLHARMNVILGPDPRAGFDRAAFYPWHRAYLWISTAQWLCALAYLAIELTATERAVPDAPRGDVHGRQAPLQPK
jgi:hypothetical protein